MNPTQALISAIERDLGGVTVGYFWTLNGCSIRGRPGELDVYDRH
jgi:hypothetical protein